MMPFVTEEMWQVLVHDANPSTDGVLRSVDGLPPSIMVAPWPVAGERDMDAEARLENIMELVRGVRNLRAEYRVDAGRWVPATIVAGDDAASFQRIASVIGELPGSRLRPVSVVASLAEPLEQSATVVAGSLTLYVPLAGMVDLDQERTRLTKDMTDVQAEIERAETLLGRPGFVERAPAQVVEKERDKLAGLRDRLERLQSHLASLSA
jgi:valyl-tRNA synthetase